MRIENRLQLKKPLTCSSLEVIDYPLNWGKRKITYVVLYYTVLIDDFSSVFSFVPPMLNVAPVGKQCYTPGTLLFG